MNVLILHHLEPAWREGYKSHGTSFEQMQRKALHVIRKRDFDKVILTRFEDHRACPSEGYDPELLKRITEIHDYAYGWEAAQMEEHPDRFCAGGSHSQAVLIDDWMLPLKKANNVTVAGAFDGECLEDLSIALNHLNINFQREESLIV